MEKREQSLNEYRSQIENIDNDKILKLTSKVRPQIADMALPLRKSANNMALTYGSERTVAARLNIAEAFDINSRELSSEVSTEEIRIAAYDRDTGVGKLDIPSLDIKRINFSVPLGIRVRMRPKLAVAIDRDTVPSMLRLFQDRSGAITSALIEDILPGDSQ